MASPGSLRVQTAHAAVSSGGAETVGRFLTIFLSIATARALLPEQVGLLGIGVIVVGLISMVASYAETAAVVSHGPGQHEDYAMAALLGRGVLTVGLVAGLFAVLPAIAPWLVGGKGSSADLETIVHLLAWQPIIEVLGAYPRVLVQRRLDLVYLAIVNLAQAIVHVGVAVVLLWRGLGALGVVWGALAAVLVAAVLAWLRLPGSGAPFKRMSCAGALRAFGADFARVFTNGFFTYVNAQVDKVLVSGALGPAAMSFYGMAWNASRFPSGVLAQSLRFSLLPAVARLQEDRAAVERALVESLRHSMLLAAPIAALLFVAAPSLVTVVLGERWLPVVPVLRVMSVAVLAAPVWETAATLLIGMGRAHLTAIASTLTIVVLVAAVPPMALRWGVGGAAYANLASAVVLTVSAALTARSAFAGIRWLRASIFVTSLPAAVFAALAALALGSRFGVGGARLAVETLTISGLYPLGVSFCGGRETLVTLLELVRHSWPSLRMVPRSAG